MSLFRKLAFADFSTMRVNFNVTERPDRVGGRSVQFVDTEKLDGGNSIMSPFDRSTKVHTSYT